MLNSTDKKDKSFTRFFSKNRGFQRQSLWSLAAASEIPARRSGRNTRAAHGAKSPVVQSAIRRWRNPHGVSRKAAVPTPSRVADGGLFVHPTVGRGILDAPKPHPIRGRQGCRPLRRWWSTVRHGGGGKPPPYGVEPIGPQKPERACQRRDTQVPPYVPCRQSVRVRRAAPMCAAVPYRMTLGSAWGRIPSRPADRKTDTLPLSGGVSACFSMELRITRW